MKLNVLASLVLLSALSVGAPALAQQDPLLKKNGCYACHRDVGRMVGPGYNEVAEKYRGESGAEARLEQKVRNGGYGVWGQLAMPPHPAIAEDELKALITTILRR
jgi:cytochrome c